MREGLLKEGKSRECYQENINREVRNDSGWVWGVEVHPHGLERVRFYVLVAMGEAGEAMRERQ
jgi:hypothetical protein